MDPTTQVALAAIAGALVAGGAVLAWHVSDRQLHEASKPAEPTVPPGATAVLSVLKSSAMLVDPHDLVLRASAPAYAMGLVRGNDVIVPELVELIGQVRSDGQIREAELQLDRPGHPPRHVSVRVAPLGTRLVVVLVEDRTRERRLEAVRRDFVANVSHELKTPVGAIRLLSEATGDAAGDPEAVKRFSKRMRKESDRLGKLVQQIIELSRLQDDDPLESPMAVPVSEVLAVAADATATDAEARDIRLVVRCEEGLEIAGIADEISLAVGNLVANAVSYSSPGSTVQVKAKGSGDTVEISVVDQGIGIPAAEVDRIFERFYRVDPARHRSTGGTGLGLSIVKHVAASHGGDVTVWSVEGHGSTFTLTLPRSKQEDGS